MENNPNIQKAEKNQNGCQEITGDQLQNFLSIKGKILDVYKIVRDKKPKGHIRHANNRQYFCRILNP